MTAAERNYHILTRHAAGASIDDLAAEYDLDRSYVRLIIREPQPWEKIGLDTRVYWCLRNMANVDPTDIDTLACMSPAELLKLPNFGVRSLNVMREYLRRHGRDFAEIDSPHVAPATAQEARQRYEAAVAERKRAEQAERDALTVWARLERTPADQQGA